MSQKINLGNVLKNMGSSLKEVTSKVDEALGDFDEKILAILKPILDVFKSEWKEDVSVIKEEVEKVKEELKRQMEEELAKIHAQIEEVGVDLSDLAEYDFDHDGVVEVDEFLKGVVDDLKEGKVDWNVFVGKALKFAHDELGDDIHDKLKVIEFFTKLGDEYDFDLQKYLHLYNDYLSKLL